ncbi:uncharacterized protein LOC131936365 isoform X2 [Physella acuta]|nr:uncharacterized protein LOC131936365 isoform X2 [Physella acuta]
MGIQVAKSKNVSEPQWLCLNGSTCPWGHFLDKLGTVESCSYCGAGCQTCNSFSNCDQCLLGFRLSKTTLENGREESHCVTTGIPCPNPPENCEHEVFASSVVGCQGCIFCQAGFLPIANSNYRRSADNKTADYDYLGLTISGTIEINEARYTCIKGLNCPAGFHMNVRGDLKTCEASATT